MKTKKLAEVLTFYRDWLVARRHVVPLQDSGGALSYAHLAGLCDVAVRDWLPVGKEARRKTEKVGKALRCLGFVQGVLVAWCDFTTAEVKSHSRSKHRPAIVEGTPSAETLEKVRDHARTTVEGCS